MAWSLKIAMSVDLGSLGYGLGVDGLQMETYEMVIVEKPRDLDRGFACRLVKAGSDRLEGSSDQVTGILNFIASLKWSTEGHGLGSRSCRPQLFTISC